MDIINKNAVYKAYLVRYGNSQTYNNIAQSLIGKGTLDEKEKKLLIKIVEDALLETIRNISKS